MMASGPAFSLLHRDVQRQLWKMGWAELRPLQVDAIQQILETTAHVILSAATAAGKTEAAFLPILSKIATEPTGSVRVIYVGPLKALINDQFARVEQLCSRLEMPVHRWHGDVGATEKTRLIDEPSGVLLITPESLESLFVNRSHALHSLFGGLRFVVIDELHSFLSNERGVHLRSLLYRLLSEVDERQFRLVGLSATLGEPSVAITYLSPDDPSCVTLIEDRQPDRELKLRIHTYREVMETPERHDDEGDQTETEENEPCTDVQAIAMDIVRHCHGHTNLIFANAKADMEEYADACKRIGESQMQTDSFLVHHGSLSAQIREDTEALMKTSVAATTFCSSTLEMGIDIGSVRMVGQIGAPFSVTSLTQRLGRSGRKEGTPRILRIYLGCREPGPDAVIFDRLYLELVQAIALTELMLEQWVEPPHLPACDLSTLTQQIISVISQMGSGTPEGIYRLLCRNGAFRDVESALFAKLLRELANRDVVEQVPEGDLILGLRGERIRKDKGFYAVFATPKAYAVIHNGENLGQLECKPEVDQHLMLAGRRWRVEAIDDEKLVLHVKPAKGRRRTPFAGDGIGEVHPAVRKKMKQVLVSNTRYVYIDTTGGELLQDARGAMMEAGLGSATVFSVGPRETALLTWTGTRIQRTIRAMLSDAGAEAVDEGIALVLRLPASDVSSILDQCITMAHDPLLLAHNIYPRARQKYDHLLSDELLDTVIARNRIDIPGALRVLKEVRAGAHCLH